MGSGPPGTRGEDVRAIRRPGLRKPATDLTSSELLGIGYQEAKWPGTTKQSASYVDAKA